MWLTPTVGEEHFWWVRVGQWSRYSQVLLQPVGVPATPAAAMLHTKSFPRQPSW